jgi:hypothetical protein
MSNLYAGDVLPMATSPPDVIRIRSLFPSVRNFINLPLCVRIAKFPGSFAAMTCEFPIKEKIVPFSSNTIADVLSVEFIANLLFTVNLFEALNDADCPIPTFVPLSNIKLFPSVDVPVNLDTKFVVPVPVTGLVNVFCFVAIIAPKESSPFCRHALVEMLKVSTLFDALPILKSPLASATTFRTPVPDNFKTRIVLSGLTIKG